MTLFKPTRREILGGAAAICAGVSTSVFANAEKPGVVPGMKHRSSYLDILRRPDRVAAFSSQDVRALLEFQSGEWGNGGISIRAEPNVGVAHGELPVSIVSPRTPLTHLHLRWNVRMTAGLKILGDHWERSYGDLEWRGCVSDRVMPWYFVTFDGQELNGYGVKTGPAALCFWQLDPDGVSLWMDLRNGGNAVELGQRELHAATIVTYEARADEKPMEAAKRFCQRMCPGPRLPKDPLVGSNDWYYAYGSNTASGILRDADLIASLTSGKGIRPFITIDDGWQDRSRFPNMTNLAEEIHTRNLRSGIWIRPMRAPKDATPSLLLPAVRFGKNSNRNNLAYDPTIPEALEEILASVRTAVSWRYELIKHDYSTYEILGRWGFEMGAQPTLQGWSFSDRSQTNAEIIANLYRSLRDAAGESTIILGCNTVGHLAAGYFEAQRIGDDNSGLIWERTRKMGVNTLAHRMSQHLTFSFVDADCVAITKDVDWKFTGQWLDLVARSGTALFVSAQQEAVGPDQKAALREAFLVVAASRGVAEDWLNNTTPQKWRLGSGESVERQYDWCGTEGAFPFHT